MFSDGLVYVWAVKYKAAGFLNPVRYCGGQIKAETFAKIPKGRLKRLNPSLLRRREPGSFGIGNVLNRQLRGSRLLDSRLCAYPE